MCKIEYRYITPTYVYIASICQESVLFTTNDALHFIMYMCRNIFHGGMISDIETSAGGIHAAICR